MYIHLLEPSHNVLWAQCNTKKVQMGENEEGRKDGGREWRREGRES